MNRLSKLYKKLHKWPGLIFSFILLYYGISGIFMNHREFFSCIDINRNNLPEVYHYKNWNNSALKGNLIINKDSILIYGNIGVWVTDSRFEEYTSLNKDFPKGSDNRKVFDLHRTPEGHLYAATHFGLFALNNKNNTWEKFQLDVDINRFVAIESVQDTLYILNRSYLFKGKSKGIESSLEKIEIKPAENIDNKVSLFETMWQIHSGEIFGIPGKLFVDILGLITILLSITGIIYFFFPGIIKKRKRKQKSVKKISMISKWSLKWHNKIGTWTFIFLIILFFTGMFLRPPLLITIAKAQIKPIKFTHLNQPNPWYDKLRDLLYDSQKQVFLLSTSEGMFYFNKNDLSPKVFSIQPPISIMGINAFENFSNGSYLTGSFNGLFLWHPSSPDIYNFINGELYNGNNSGMPIGDFKVTGILKDINNNLYMIDYDKGVIPLYHQNKFPEMPENILNESEMSLWNLSLEFHTGRFFQFLIKDFYILIVPLTGLAGIMIIVSGYLLFHNRKKEKILYRKVK